MSAENTANEPLLRRSIEAWNASDWDELESIQYFLEPEAALAAVGEDALR